MCTVKECEEVGLRTTKPEFPESGDVYVDLEKGLTYVFFFDEWNILESASKTMDYFMATKEKYFEDKEL